MEKRVDQRGLADPRLARNEDDLPFVLRCAPRRIVEFVQSLRSSDQSSRCKTGLNGGSRQRDFAVRPDESVPASRQGLDESRPFRVILQDPTDIEDLTFQPLWLDKSARPHRVEQLVLRYQPAGVLDQIEQDTVGFWRQQKALIVTGIALAPQALVNRV